MKRPRVDLTEAKAQILCRLHFAIAENKKFDNGISSISENVGCSFFVANLAVGELRNNGFCTTFTREDDDEVIVEITREGIQDVENWNDEYYFKIANKLKLTLAAESRKEEGDSESTNLAPASDRIVTLEHNKPARQIAVDAIQEVIAEAEKSNEFGQLFADPDERIVALSEMKSAWVILRDEAVARFSTIKNFIADRLAMIVNKIPDAMVGVLAKKAIDALEAFIKGLF